MTLIGPDVASFQAGLDLASLTDASYFLIKSTEGDSYVDPYYEGWVTQAKAVGKPYAWYHFISADASPAAQAAHIASVVDHGAPGMLDVEPTTASIPSFATMLAVIDAILAEGLKLKIVYLPRWFWQQLGNPDLSVLTARGLIVVSSDYPGASGTGPNQYEADGGDSGPGWAPYGGITPGMWQYTDTAAEGGQKVDYSAYRGTENELAAFLQEPVTTVTATSSTGRPQLSMGATGAAVQQLQYALNNHDFQLTVDGQFGARTQGAVKAYQYGRSLTVDGIVGPATWTAIDGGRAALGYPGQQENGGSGVFVRQLQQELAYRGYTLSVDAQFGPRTQNVVRQFQAAHSLTQDGIVGPVTWGQLFK